MALSLLPVLLAAGGVFLLTRRDGITVQRASGASPDGPAPGTDADAGKTKPLNERFDLDLKAYQAALKTDKASVSPEQAISIKNAFYGTDERARAYALKALGDQASNLEIFSNESSRKAAAQLAVDFQDKFEEIGKRGAKAKKLLETVIAKNAIPFDQPDKRFDAYGVLEKALVDLVVDIPEAGSAALVGSLADADALINFPEGKQAVFTFGPKDVLTSMATKIDGKTYQGYLGKLVEAKSFAPAGRYAVLYIAPSVY